MKKRNTYLSGKPIDLVDAIRLLWREKILILSISFICMVIGYVYSNLQPKTYKIEFFIEDLSEFELGFFNDDFFFSKKIKTGEIDEIFKLELLSLQNFAAFVKENNKISDSKNHLGESNISSRKYFEGKLNYNQKLDNYTLTYTGSLLAETFLNDYIVFVKKKTLKSFQKKLIQKISMEIKLLKFNLRIAEQVNIKDFCNNMYIYEIKDLLYCASSKSISAKIFSLNELLNETRNLTLDNYNPILKETSNPILISRSTEWFMSIAFGFGLFLSVIIIFLRYKLL